MTTQHALTVVARVRSGQEQTLRAVLEKIHDNDVETNPWIPFAEITTVHFARFVVVPDRTGDGAQLVLSTNHDGPLDAHLRQLLEKGRAGLEKIYSHCEGFPSGGDAGIIAYLKERSIPVEAFYVGTRGRSVLQIRRESELRDEIERVIDAERAAYAGRPDAALRIRECIQEHIGRDPRWNDAMSSKDDIPPDNSRRLLVGIVAAVLALAGLWFVTPLIPLGVLLLVTLVVVAFVLVLRGEERSDELLITPPAADPKRVRELSEREDKIVQNQLTHVVDIKPGRFRYLTLKIVLTVINAAAAARYTQGKLGDIPSIHFARWVMIDNGTRLLFFSNFDGSWENYLGDFIDKAATGLTAVWSNTVNFPRTSYLLFNGATDEHNFKEWARAAQIPTDLWYSAYKFLTVENINNNTRIRRGLKGRMTEAEATEWLRRL